LHPAAPLRLDGETGGWLLTTGRLDLFAVPLIAGEPEGPRFPLCSVEAGGIVLALPASSDCAVIAVGHDDAAAARLTLSELLRCQISAVEAWIVGLAAAVFGDRPEPPAAIAETGRPLVLAPGQRAAASRGLA